MLYEDFVAFVKHHSLNGPFTLIAGPHQEGKFRVMLTIQDPPKWYSKLLFERGFKRASTAKQRAAADTASISTYLHPETGVGVMKSEKTLTMLSIARDGRREMQSILKRLRRNGFSVRSIPVERMPSHYHFRIKPI